MPGASLEKNMRVLSNPTIFHGLVGMVRPVEKSNIEKVEECTLEHANDHPAAEAFSTLDVV
jgi:hypothetical protein